MKILHTSDWHLGQELYCFDRTEEHLSFLSQIENIVKEEQPDALVVSGDIYHNSTPSNSVMRMFSDALLKIANVNPQMKIIITAGNHDSSSRLEITRNIWQRLNVEVIGGIEKVDGDYLFAIVISDVPTGVEVSADFTAYKTDSNGTVSCGATQSITLSETKN